MKPRKQDCSKYELFQLKAETSYDLHIYECSDMSIDKQTHTKKLSLCEDIFFSVPYMKCLFVYTQKFRIMNVECKNWSKLYVNSNYLFYDILRPRLHYSTEMKKTTTVSITTNSST